MFPLGASHSFLVLLYIHATQNGEQSKGLMQFSQIILNTVNVIVIKSIFYLFGST